MPAIAPENVEKDKKKNKKILINNKNKKKKYVKICRKVFVDKIKK